MQKMKKMKNFKRSVILSAILCMCMCLSLLAGATFALFTSEAKVNIAITSGKVDVQATISEMKLSHMEWNSTNGTYEEVEGSLFAGSNANLDEENQVLTISQMVPMDKISLNINIKNNSNINAMYRLVVSSLENDGLFSGLVIKINGNEYLGAKLITEYEQLEVNSTDKNILVTIELPQDAGNEYQDKSCKISYAVEAIQANASNGIYEVTPENAQTVLDTIEGDATVVLTEGDYEKLYLRQSLEASTRRTDLDVSESSYPAYYREFKNVTIKAKENANVTCDGIMVEAGLFWHASAPASNQDVIHANSGFISYILLENIVIEGITFDNTSTTAVLLRDNASNQAKGSTLYVDGFMITNCKATGDTSNSNIHFFSAGSGSNDLAFCGSDASKVGINNVIIANNEANSYYQPICMNNAVAILNNLMVKNNTFTDCVDNIVQLSNKTNRGEFIFDGNTFTNMQGRFIRMANASSNAVVRFKNNTTITPKKYDADGLDIAKITSLSGDDGFKVYCYQDDWTINTNTTSKWIAYGNEAILPTDAYSTSGN